MHVIKIPIPYLSETESPTLIFSSTARNILYSLRAVGDHNFSLIVYPRTHRHGDYLLPALRSSINLWRTRQSNNLLDRTFECLHLDGVSQFYRYREHMDGFGLCVITSTELDDLLSLLLRLVDQL